MNLAKIPLIPRWIILIAVLAVIALGHLLFVYEPGLSDRIVRGALIELPAQGNKEPFKVELATSSAAQERGLSGRTDVPEGYGMLFVFSEAGSYGIWMKDMLVPIDILWLSDTGEVITVKADARPESYPDVFYPSTPARYVLETRDGEAARRGWRQGSVIPLPSL
jgi:uncharacterized membrane protein (UPF0127 family)